MPNNHLSNSNNMEDISSNTLQSKHQAIVNKLHQIGKHYLKSHGYIAHFFGVHTNKKRALTLASYSHDVSDYQHHKKFIFNQLLSIPNQNGEIAKKLADILKSDYKIKEVTPQLLAENISDEVINQLGRDYLTEYPTPGILKLHCHQKHATRLQDYQSAANATALDRWNFLMEVYSTVKSAGTFATNIEAFVTNALNITIKISEAYGGSGAVVLYKTTADIANNQIKPVYKQLLPANTEQLTPRSPNSPSM